MILVSLFCGLIKNYYLCNRISTNILKTRLGNIASVRSGIYAKPDYQGEVYYIQAKNFDEQNDFLFNSSPELALDRKIRNNLLQPGEIILAARGNNNFAAHYKGRISPVVASTMFLVISIRDKEKLLPDYLTWYLNLKTTQKHLRSFAQSTSIPSLNKAQVEDLEIPVPDLKKQNDLIEYAELRKKESVLRKKLEEMKELQNEQLLLNAFN